MVFAVGACPFQTVVLDSAVDPESAANKGNVERWLLELEAMQWQSVRTQVTLSLEEYPKVSREKWVLNWPAQAVLGVSQVSTVLQQRVPFFSCSSKACHMIWAPKWLYSVAVRLTARTPYASVVNEAHAVKR